ncbi:hypothetical protein [Polyangium fumosum]|uniref:AgmX/PglI C-terminal domain-containing protein n=1 Tax=Polyangium fumosum TaxID=889272 RepID=A0A4U1IL46_9BACT|nr:hypothetical protein [Polyangium fumosum]TKC94710.1 hypothetical protein E8A74_47825 [Polyangium fumosum]
MFRPAHAFVMATLAAPLVAACGSPPVSPAAPRTSEAPPVPLAPRAAECARLQAVLDTEMRDVPAAEIRSTTPMPRVEELMHRLERSCDASERLADELEDSTLACEANDFRLATAYLLLTTAHIFGLVHRGEPDLAPFDRAADVAARQRELVYRSARARCIDDGSRDQSPEWGEATKAILRERTSAIHECHAQEKLRAPDRKIGKLEMKLHIAEDGHVELVGPTAYSALSAASPEFVSCLVRVFGPMRFPPPTGRAIVTMPFVE